MNTINFIMRPGAFRLLLACIVLLNHSTRVDLGYMAVFVFFALSGFWITRMWLERYSKFENAYVAFLVSRIWRLWPVYITTFAISVVIYWSLSGGMGIPPFGWLPNLFVLGLASLPPSAARLGQAWSLDIEVQFYLLAPMIVWLVARGSGLIRRAAVLAILAVSIVAFRFLTWPVISHSVLPFFGLFFIGVVAAVMDRPIDRRLVCVTSFLGLAIVAGILLHPDLRYMILGGRHPLPIFVHNWSLCAVLALIFTPYALATTSRADTRVDAKMGAISYIVYLIHMPVLSIYVFYYGHLPPFERLPHLMITWIVIAATSWAIFRLIDVPSERRRQRFLHRQGKLTQQKIENGQFVR